MSTITRTVLFLIMVKNLCVKKPIYALAFVLWLVSMVFLFTLIYVWIEYGAMAEFFTIGLVTFGSAFTYFSGYVSQKMTIDQADLVVVGRTFYKVEKLF